jgi:hypothetical protein
MCKYLKTLIIISLLIGSIPQNAMAKSSIDINELVENANELDGQDVTIQGEAIGECMNRGEYSWININDGTNAIGVWINKSEADKISYYGNYKYHGDMVKITGTFYRACKEHGGEADFHGSSLVIVKKGYHVKEQISYLKIIAAFISVLVTVPLVMLFLRTLRNKRLIGS